jgi:hypothetical protein
VGDAVIGWGNLSVVSGRLAPSFGYVAGGAPKALAFRRALDEEVARIEAFLGIGEET